MTGNWCGRARSQHPILLTHQAWIARIGIASQHLASQPEWMVEYGEIYRMDVPLESLRPASKFHFFHHLEIYYLMPGISLFGWGVHHVVGEHKVHV
jgi:hypothetical protein